MASAKRSEGGGSEMCNNSVTGHRAESRHDSEEVSAATPPSDERDLQHARAELEAIYDNAPIGLCILDTELRFVRLNHRLAEMNGRSVADHIGRTVREVVPDLADEAEAGMRRVLATGEPLLDVEITGETAARPGLLRTWSESWLPLRGAKGAVTGLAIVVREITEQRRAEAAARDEAARFKALLQVLPAGMYTCDTDGVITYFNDRAAEIWGRVPEADDTERRFCGAFRLRSPDGAPLAHRDTPMAEAARSGASVRGQQVIMERADGEQVRVSVNIDPLRDGDGAIIGAVNVFTDVSALHEAQEALQLSEARHRELVEGARSAIVRWQRDGTISYANPYAEQIFGYRPGGLVGRHVATLLPPLDVTDRDLSGLIEDILDRPEHYAHSVNENVSRDGSLHWFAWTSRPVLGADGEVLEIMAVGIDITDQKRAEFRLQELATELEQQVADRTALAERRAEQLRALVVELIEAEEEERSRVAELLHDDLQQLLAGARLRIGAVARRLDLESDLADVERLLADALNTARTLSHHLSPAVLHHAGLRAAIDWLAREIAEQFDVSVNLEMDDVDDVQSRPIKMLVFRAVQELLFNVVKHADSDHADVVVRRRDGLLRIVVTDEGAGFDAHSIDVSQAPGGFGLLKLRERISAMGGRLKIRSDPGDGCRVTIILPLLEEAAIAPNSTVAETEARVAEPSPTALDTAAQRLQVLVVDDHQVVRQGLVGMLDDQPQIEVVGEAANGREAVALCRKLRPDVVVMDISMPEMDGIEATRRIKQELPGLRVIGLSMHDDQGTARSMHEAGAEAFVSKAVSAAELLKVIYGFEDSSHDGPPTASAPPER